MSGENHDGKLKRLLGRMKDKSRAPSASGSSGFEYQPLNPSHKEIRLLNIQSAQDGNGPIHITLYHSRLEDITDYCALSYTWGDPNRTRPIFVNDAEFQVTINLEGFLRQWHVLNANDLDPIPFWIDAISINQNDLSERSSQVSMMSDIYSNASVVFVWLGSRQAYSERAFDLIEDLGKIVHENIGKDLEPVTKWVADHTSPLFSNCSWMGAADLLNRSWWSRAWVVQEVVLAKNVVVMCGKYSLPYHFFLHASSVLTTHAGTLMSAATAGYNNSTHPDECLLASNRFRRLTDGASNVRVITTTATHRMHGNTDTAFYNLIRRHNKAEATDPHDRVYAYLGLAHENHDEVAGVPINYTLPAADLYRIMAKQHLRQRRRLDILNDCYGIGLPDGYSSWAPFYKSAWLPAGDMLFSDSPPHIQYHAASTMEPRFDFADNDEVLLLDGVLVDTIKTIGELCDLCPGHTVQGLDYNPDNILITWRRLLGFGDIVDELMDDSQAELTDEQFARFRAIGLCYPTGISKLEAWFRTILCNPQADFQANYVNPETTAFGMDNRWTDRKCAPDGSDDEHLRARTGITCIDRRFYITSKGYYGLGPPVTAVGDVVCVPLGSKTPFLLRPDADCYLIISETYVHGFMSGEIVAELERGTMVVEKFPLR